MRHRLALTLDRILARLVARAAIGPSCMLLLSSLTTAPDEDGPRVSVGLAIQQIDIGNAIAALHLPSLMILFLLVALPSGYWVAARLRLRWRRASR